MRCSECLWKAATDLAGVSPVEKVRDILAGRPAGQVTATPTQEEMSYD